jgi:hypothetical protein
MTFYPVKVGERKKEVRKLDDVRLVPGKCEL